MSYRGWCKRCGRPDETISEEGLCYQCQKTPAMDYMLEGIRMMFSGLRTSGMQAAIDVGFPDAWAALSIGPAIMEGL